MVPNLSAKEQIRQVMEQVLTRCSSRGTQVDGRPGFPALSVVQFATRGRDGAGGDDCRRSALSRDHPPDSTQPRHQTRPRMAGEVPDIITPQRSSTLVNVVAPKCRSGGGAEQQRRTSSTSGERDSAERRICGPPTPGAMRRTVRQITSGVGRARSGSRGQAGG